MVCLSVIFNFLEVVPVDPFLAKLISPPYWIFHVQIILDLLGLREIAQEFQSSRFDEMKTGISFQVNLGLKKVKILSRN